MPRKRVWDPKVPKIENPYLAQGVPVIPGRKLLPGRKTPPFPAFYHVEERPVTFRLSAEGDRRSREERETMIVEWLRRANRGRRLSLILIPFHHYANPKTAVFHAGWTLRENDEGIRTHQCVVFLAGEGFPIGRSDQGVICVALRKSLSAWNGLTDEQTRLRAA